MRIAKVIGISIFIFFCFNPLIALKKMEDAL